jgi:prepilin-type processing-associated H-X9-DG protein
MSRAGVSLVEVLVSIGVIGLLVALILPAVQASRESGRNMQCRNNLRQLGTAFHSYHSDYGVFPVELLPFRRILPYLEQAALAEDLEKQGTNNSLPRFGVRAYICPTDSWAQPEMGHTNYLVNEGSGFQAFGNNGVRLPFASPRRFTRAADILDGLSHTACLAERLVSRVGAAPSETDATPRWFLWFIPTAMTGASQLDAFAAACRSSRTTALPVLLPAFQWLETDQGYNHVLPPNVPGCHNGNPTQGVLYSPQYDAIPASSEHPGGVNLLLADGSVKFVSDVIDLKVWRAVASRAGGETLANELR